MNAVALRITVSLLVVHSANERCNNGEKSVFTEITHSICNVSRELFNNNTSYAAFPKQSRFADNNTRLMTLGKIHTILTSAKLTKTKR